MRSLIKKSWYTIRRLHPKKKDLRHANNQEKKKDCFPRTKPTQIYSANPEARQCGS
jgi:hypothetical protein